MQCAALLRDHPGHVQNSKAVLAAGEASGDRVVDVEYVPEAVLGRRQNVDVEVLVGMLDAYAMFGEERYWEAFRNVNDFFSARMVNMEAGGEWFERLDRHGRPIDAALGHAWKICYHAVRSMIETIRRLERLP